MDDPTANIPPSCLRSACHFQVLENLQSSESDRQGRRRHREQLGYESATSHHFQVGPAPPLLYDIDFCCLSYDVAFSKPDARIFTAAETTASAILSQRGGALDHNLDPSHCIKVHVGDNYSEDVMGALSAGWNAVLVGSPAFTPGKTDFVLSEAHLPRRAYPGSDAVLMSTPISRVFSDDPARPPVSLRVPDIRTLRKWLMHTQPDEDSNEEGELLNGNKIDPATSSTKL
ncbi:hypothetical protein B0T17DRAFT_621574 [Bombardia bombarda]|uniref:Uncharacterized protein n=1 Tax=Bombardia bombarda TaxID=252184 RepID=A0AA39U117_9PEZI|nr:hypothetical protein B0T17DRAFT_621574 [Bombardia bombarda]